MTVGRLLKMIPIRLTKLILQVGLKEMQDDEERGKKTQAIFPERSAACQVHFLTTARAPSLPWGSGCAAEYRQSQQEAHPIIAAASMGQA